jgi:hypothetical protein
MTASEARKRAGLTIAQVAARIATSEETVRAAERVGGRASFDLAEQLARIYHCDASVILATINGGRPANILRRNQPCKSTCQRAGASDAGSPATRPSQSVCAASRP